MFSNTLNIGLFSPRIYDSIILMTIYHKYTYKQYRILAFRVTAFYRLQNFLNEMKDLWRFLVIIKGFSEIRNVYFFAHPLYDSWLFFNCYNLGNAMVTFLPVMTKKSLEWTLKYRRKFFFHWSLIIRWYILHI